MPTYRIKDPTSGKTIRLRGDTPPTEKELDEFFSKINVPEKGAAVSAVEPKQPKENGVGKASAYLSSIPGVTPPGRHPVRLTPGVERAVFPRAMKVAAKEGEAPIKTAGRVMAGGVADILSIPGRALAAAPTLAPGGEKFGEAFARKGAPENAGIVRKITESIVRDPALPLAAATAGAAAPARTALGKMGQAALLGTKEGVVSAAVHQAERFAEQGDFDALDAIVETAMSAATAGGLKGLGDVLGEGLKKAGKKIQLSSIRPSKKAVGTGFNVDNIFKHNLEGTLEESLEKSEKKIIELSQELAGELEESTTRVNVLDLLQKVEDDLIGTTQKKAAQTGNLKAIKKALEDYSDDITEATADGNLDLLSANLLKRSVGKQGAWNVIQPTADIVAKQKVANKLYGFLRRQIEDAAKDSEAIKRINKEMSEIIPIERAVIDRIPVAQRQDLFSLTDVVSILPVIRQGTQFGPGALLFPIINKLSKVPKVGAKLYRAGEKAVEQTGEGVPSRLIRAGARQQVNGANEKVRIERLKNLNLKGL